MNTKLIESKWLYAHNRANTARYILGTVGERPLVCLGINPSIAEPNRLDQTVGLVNRVAGMYGYDSFVMLNVYPQRATNPNDLHKEFVPELKAENEKYIAALIDSEEHELWAAWGGLVLKRPYLLQLVHDIVTLPELKNCTWISRGNPTKGGHPHHPLYVRKDVPFSPFDISMYI